jgi:hypothetical protein
MSTLADWTSKNIPSLEGGAPKQHKLTHKKVKLGSMERNVHVGPRGGKYVKVNGEMVSLKKAKDAANKKK